MSAPTSAGRVSVKAFFAFAEILKRLEGLGVGARQTLTKKYIPS